MIKLDIFRVSPTQTSGDVVDNVFGVYAIDHAFESRSKSFSY